MTIEHKKRWDRLMALGSCLGVWWFIIPPLYASDLSLAGLDSIRMVKDIQVLSRPEFSGRQTGTDGDLASVIFVAR